MRSALSDGVACIMVNVTDRVRLRKTPPSSLAFAIQILIPCCLGLSHRRAPMAIGDDIQHRYRMLAVRTPFPRLVLSLPTLLCLVACMRNGHLTIGVFVSPVTRIGPRTVAAS